MSTPVRALLVEDEAIIAEDLRSILESAGFEVVGIATSEEAALAIASEGPVDIALVDIRIQRDANTDGSLAGLRLAEELWTADRIPVVFVTAFPELINRLNAEHTGAFGVVAKPFSPAVVIGQVHLAIARAAANQR